MRRFGVYLETGYKFINGDLLCQDIYVKVLNLISERNNINFNYLLKICEFDNGYNVKSSNKLFYLISYKNLFSLIWKFPFYRILVSKKVKEFIDNCDTIIIMTPSPVSKLLFKFSYLKKKKIILLVRQDIVEMNKTRYQGFKKYFANYFSNYYQNYFLKHIDNNNITIITSGEMLAQKFRNYSSKVISFADSRYSIIDVIENDKIQKINFEDKLHFLFVGRLEINKGILILLDFAKKYSNRIALTIVGNGLMMDHIQKYLIENNLSNTVNITGHIEYGPALLEYYRKAQFFIFPSYSEGLPQVIFEAMANGCVIFSSNVGSISTVVKDNFNGILFNPNDLDEFYFKANKIFNKEYNLDDFRIKSLEIAKNYSFENQIQIFENILNE